MKIAFPPKAHYASEGVIRNTQGTVYPMRPIVVSDQPASRGMTLTVNSDHGDQSVDGPMRLRGGCIPCPVRSIAIYEFKSGNNGSHRMEDAAILSLFLAAANLKVPFHERGDSYPNKPTNNLHKAYFLLYPQIIYSLSPFTDPSSSRIS